MNQLSTYRIVNFSRKVEEYICGGINYSGMQRFKKKRFPFGQTSFKNIKNI